jgi:hypothetical protein
MRYVIDVLAVIGALWIAGTVFFAVSDTIKGNQIERLLAASQGPR